MKVERINEELFDIFINFCYFKNVDLSNKIDLINVIKELLVKIDSRYNLNINGFYKIKVYPKDKIGIFLNIIKIDDNEFSSGSDFRIVIYSNEKFLLETDNYEILDQNILKKYYNGKFYIDIDDIKNIYNIIDMGNIIYGKAVKKILTESINIK